MRFGDFLANFESGVVGGEPVEGEGIGAVDEDVNPVVAFLLGSDIGEEGPWGVSQKRAWEVSLVALQAPLLPLPRQSVQYATRMSSGD